MVAVGSAIAAIAYIVFTVLAVKENSAFSLKISFQTHTMAENIKELDDSSFSSTTGADVPVLVDFSPPGAVLVRQSLLSSKN